MAHSINRDNERIPNKEYWKRRLKGVVQGSLNGKLESGGSSEAFREERMDLPFRIGEGLMELTKGKVFNVYKVLLSSLSIIAYRYTQQEEVLICAPSLDLRGEGRFCQTKMFLRIRIHPNKTFRDLLNNIHDLVIEAYERQDYPLETFLREFQHEECGDIKNLFRIGCFYNQVHQDDSAIEDCEISFRFAAGPQGHSLVVRYDSALYSVPFVRHIICHLMLGVDAQNASIDQKVDGNGQLLSTIRPFEYNRTNRLTFGQERLWFIDALMGSRQYHMPWVVRLQGEVRISSLELTIRKVIDRHEILRTIIRQEEGRPYGTLIESNDWNLTVIDISAQSEGAEDLQSRIKELVHQPFDLSKDYPLRACVLRLSQTDSVLVVTIHHIAADGWSLPILAKEFVNIYKTIESPNDLLRMERPLVQYADFAQWQRISCESETFNAKLAYWKEKLSGVEPLNLPTTYSRPPVMSTRGDNVAITIGQRLTSQVVSFSKFQAVTLFMTLLATFKVLLYRYSGQCEIVVGTPVAGRQLQEVEDLIGFFVNTLVLRSDLRNNPSFLKLLAQVKETVIAAFDNQDVPFEKIIETMVNTRDMRRSPLFQVLFALQNTPEVPSVSIPGMSLTQESFNHYTSKFDLTFSLTERAGELDLRIEYCTDLFSKEAIIRMACHFEQLLGSVVKMPHQDIARLPMLTQGEEDQLLVAFNDTAVCYPYANSVVEMFAKQVTDTPNSIAIQFEGEILTYQELDERTNQLASYLQEWGVKPETLVPICLHRSVAMMVGILGILKAGGAYVPIDPEFPLERIDYILSDVGKNLVVSYSTAVEKLEAIVKRFNIIDLKDDWPTILKKPTSSVVSGLQPNNLAYVIYTSGSTGNPKGVMIEHKSLMNRLNWAQSVHQLTEQDRVLQKTTFCFDVSVWELLWPLVVGARLVFASPGGQKDTRYLTRIIADQSITTMHFVPSMLEVFLADVKTGEGRSLKRVLCSGEALSNTDVRAFHKAFPHAELYNLYGPTEAAIDVSYWQSPNAADITVVPIGRPIANTTLYVLDCVGQLLPIGVPGELYIGGIQIARGYLNKPELTAEKFMPVTFNRAPARYLYKTGDLARWLEDGNIEYLGRSDNQVKIRGYRIELEEIESVLRECPGVIQCAVVVNEALPYKRLIAFVVLEKALYQTYLRKRLEAQLPEYMVPSFFFELEKLPLTSNGKVDRKALAAYNTTSSEHKYSEPENELEQRIARIWMTILNIDILDVNDNFFEVGGHSLLAMRIIAALKRELGVDLPVRALFHLNTVRLMASSIQLRNSQAFIHENYEEIKL